MWTSTSHANSGEISVGCGLLARPDQHAARALAICGVSADSVRRAVIDRVGTGPKLPSGHILYENFLYVYYVYYV